MALSRYTSQVNALPKVAIVTGLAPASAAATLGLLANGFAVVAAGGAPSACRDAAAVAGGRRARPGASTDVTNAQSVRVLFDATKDFRAPRRFSTTPASARRRAARRADRRTMAGGGRRQPDGRVPVHAAGVPADEAAGPTGRPHHQQRVDFGVCAAAELGALYRQQARHHGVDAIHVARRPGLGHRLRPDRHRQCRHGHDRAIRGGHAAGERRDQSRAPVDVSTSTLCSTWRGCRSTPTSSSSPSWPPRCRSSGEDDCMAG